MTEANTVSADRKTVIILFIAKELPIRKATSFCNDFTLQYLHFVRAVLHVAIAV